MKRPRFVVGETRGYRINTAAGGVGQTGGKATEGASYAVLDTHVCYRNVGEFDSETGGGGQGRRIGRDGARARAQALADRLNAEDAAGEFSGPPEPKQPRVTVQAAVVALLATKPMRGQEIADAIGISHSHVRAMISARLIPAGQVERVSRGLYRAVPDAARLEQECADKEAR